MYPENGNVFVFKNQNPARGRKRVSSKVMDEMMDFFKNQNPARGRKPVGVRVFCLKSDF